MSACLTKLTEHQWNMLVLVNTLRAEGIEVDGSIETDDATPTAIEVSVGTKLYLKFLRAMLRFASTSLHAPHWRRLVRGGKRQQHLRPGVR